MARDEGFAFILGCPRSGTTLLSRVIGQLPYTRVAIGDLMLPATPSIHAYLEEQGRDAALRDAMAASLARELERRANTLSRADSLLAFLRGQVGPLQALQGLRQRARRRRFVFKEPFLTFAPRLALAAKPGAAIVRILRDGRDVADSLVRSFGVLSDEDLRRTGSHENPLALHRAGDYWVPWWVTAHTVDAFLAGTPFVRAAVFWKAMVERAERGLDSPPPGGLLDLRYESVVGRAGEAAAEIATFFATPLTPRLRRAAAQAHPRSIGGFHRRAAGEIRAAEALIGDCLERYGYS